MIKKKEENNWLKDFIAAGRYQERWEYEDAMFELGLPCQEEDKLKEEGDLE
ncbi:hypothetical protein ES708_03003 [subsurface metagenome]